MIRVIIVDDEMPARRRLRTLLRREPDTTIVAECSDGPAAVEAVRALSPDLMFLDIQMPEMSGFDVLRDVGLDTVPAVVFVTAYDRYALQAFDAHALDYLLKPFTNERFHDMLTRARRTLTGAADGSLQRRLESLVSAIAAPDGAHRVALKTGDRVVFVNAAEIDRVEAAGNYVRVHAGAAQHLVRDTLKGIMSRLDPQRFLRVHHSHVVNVERVRELRPWSHGEYVVVLQDGTRIASSRTYSQHLRSLVQP